MPLGAVAVVAGAGANVERVRPRQPADSMTHDWLSYGIDGLNPFMNAIPRPCATEPGRYR
jgi:hypothetical protein